MISFIRERQDSGFYSRKNEESRRKEKYSLTEKTVQTYGTVVE
jgi:hypothetical protein